MKFTWGHALIIVFVAFGGMIAYLVYGSMKTNYDLVSKEYYKDELAYQSVIDGKHRAEALSSSVKFSQANDSLTIHFPEEMKNGSIKGTALFYYAPDAARDRKLPLEASGTNELKINSRSFLPGNYTAKISWESDGQQYYSEQFIQIH